MPDAISRLQPTVSVTSAGGYDPARIAKLQRADPQLHQLITFLETGEPYHMDVAPELVQDNAHDFFIDEENVLYKLNAPDKPYKTAKLLVIPSSLKHEIVTACHDHPLAGHMGLEKTLNKIRDRYWWPHIYKEVKEYIATC